MAGALRPLLLLPMIQPLLSAEFHVSPSGGDENSGTASAPFLTLGAARDAAREFVGKEPVVVHVADGVYYLPESLVFTPADSGTGKAPVVYKADHEGKAVISGGLRIALKWEAGDHGTLKAATPGGMSIDQLFIDGKRQRMARYPNYDPGQPTAAYQGFAADAFSKERATKWADPAGGYIHAMHVARWGGYQYRITGKKPDGTVEYEGGWQNNRQMGMHKDFRMVENIFEELDAPGEWFHNTKTNTIYLMPEPGTNPSSAVVEVVRLRHLVEFKGSSDAPVKNITLSGFVYRHAARTFMETREPLLRSDWAIYRGGAVVLTGTENVSILDSEFDQPGGNAVFVNNYNRRVLIKGCHIHDAGASGVCFVGDPAAVRDPLFEYGKTQNLANIDRVAGPKTDNYPAESSVEDCLIHGIGRVERQPAGVQISMSYKITIRDTSIYDCARSGININEGTWGGHLIERCDVFDTVLETHDHGSFNSWGRDRYWASNHRGISEPEVKKDPKLPFLDAIGKNVIRDSRWRCDHGWDIDLDDGSTNYEIYNNVMLNGGLKFREGYGRNAYNNILVNGGFHPHVWFDDSASGFHHNIVMKPHAPIGQPKGWGKLVDHNFFTSENDRKKNPGTGADANSVSGDPMFVNPSTGDFRVKEGSPALKAGFRNFSMEQFGVKRASLKAIARSPLIPTIVTDQAENAAPNPKRYWLGAALHGLEGEEFSAFGVRKEDGGVQLSEVSIESAASKFGLKVNDLVQSINGRNVPDTDHLFAALNDAKDSILKVRFVRNQQSMDLVISGAPFVLIESAADSGFGKLTLPEAVSCAVNSNVKTHNDPLSVLTDGKLARTYGPVFGNDIRSGAYKMDLGATKSVRSISSWAFNQSGSRGRQIVTLFGSNSVADPGWNTADAARFIPITTIDTASARVADFSAASIQARAGETLGSFRWIVWQVEPVNRAGENSAFQELSVESGPN